MTKSLASLLFFFSLNIIQLKSFNILQVRQILKESNNFEKVDKKLKTSITSIFPKLNKKVNGWTWPEIFTFTNIPNKEVGLKRQTQLILKTYGILANSKSIDNIENLIILTALTLSQPKKNSQEIGKQYNAALKENNEQKLDNKKIIKNFFHQKNRILYKIILKNLKEKQKNSSNKETEAALKLILSIKSLKKIFNNSPINMLNKIFKTKYSIKEKILIKKFRKELFIYMLSFLRGDPKALYKISNLVYYSFVDENAKSKKFKKILIKKNTLSELQNFIKKLTTDDLSAGLSYTDSIAFINKNIKSLSIEKKYELLEKYFESFYSDYAKVSMLLRIIRNPEIINNQKLRERFLSFITNKAYNFIRSKKYKFMFLVYLLHEIKKLNLSKEFFVSKLMSFVFNDGYKPISDYRGGFVYKSISPEEKTPYPSKERAKFLHHIIANCFIPSKAEIGATNDIIATEPFQIPFLVSLLKTSDLWMKQKIDTKKLYWNFITKVVWKISNLLEGKRKYFLELINQKSLVSDSFEIKQYGNKNYIVLFIKNNFKKVLNSTKKNGSKKLFIENFLTTIFQNKKLAENSEIKKVVESVRKIREQIS